MLELRVCGAVLIGLLSGWVWLPVVVHGHQPPKMVTDADSEQPPATTDPAAQEQPPLVVREHVTVVASTPLPGVGLPEDQVPAATQVLNAQDIVKTGSLDLSDLMNRRLNGVHINEMQGNPFQADVNYRGYTASPLLGTPQGLSVYMDGVRLNQPFGDVVNWDLIPRMAISTTVLMPGSNPLFGLNTLGGALSIQTKDGRISPGTTIQATYGSDVRRAVEFEHGASRNATGLHYYLAGSLFGEDGWRDASPSDVRQIFGKIGWERPASELALSIGHANNELRGNGLQEQGFLVRRFDSAYMSAGHQRQPGDARQRHRAAGSAARAHDLRKRLLPPRAHRDAQRRPE